jgi:saccharopine dehydrogenase-like NADP-dependent oxidoreductase
MRVLVTGGAGYIGSHTCVEMLSAGMDVVVVDNLCNSKEESLRRVGEIAGRTPTFIQADLRDHAALDAIFRITPSMRLSISPVSRRSENRWRFRLPTTTTTSAGPSRSAGRWPRPG